MIERFIELERQREFQFQPRSRLAVGLWASLLALEPQFLLCQMWMEKEMVEVMEGSSALLLPQPEGDEKAGLKEDEACLM